ncbi:hypothetical protein BGZ83_000416 [Gryganskiella cystojenkinii]|nr:hypothetical protein BGZ83_000416 [Gryganskiella cystojenkinii]
MLPAAGQGAVNALQDAVILANCLYDLKDNSQTSITDAFQSYYNQRYKHAKAHYESSKLYMKLIGGSTWADRLTRSIVLEYLPESILQKELVRASSYRPQVNFLPLVEPRGSGPVLAQLPSKRYTREQQEKAKNEQKDVAVV